MHHSLFFSYLFEVVFQFVCLWTSCRLDNEVFDIYSTCTISNIFRSFMPDFKFEHLKKVYNKLYSYMLQNNESILYLENIMPSKENNKQSTELVSTEIYLFYNL